jgi:AraC family transcriptional regulator
MILQWSELFGKEHEPSDSQIKEFVDTPLWDDLDNHLKQTYNVKPKLFYSSCSMQQGMWKGWNVKYRKSGKSLCTLYPKQGHILSLVPIGLREMTEAELLIPICTEYTQNLFSQTTTGRNGKSLAFVVDNEKVLHDMKELIALRATSR